MTEEQAQGGRRRRQRRRPSGAADAAPVPAPPQDRPAQDKPQRRRRPQREQGERGLRDLVGAGRSQLGVDGALRGRDVNRPSEEDLAEADANLIIIRRHWKPDEHDRDH